MKNDKRLIWGKMPLLISISNADLNELLLDYKGPDGKLVPFKAKLESVQAVEVI